MTSEKMTVHEGLIELKTLNKRIEDAITQGIYCKANKKSNKKINGKDINTIREDIKSSFQKATDLINRRTALKKAICNSNAVTPVTVIDDTMTVAELIDMKIHKTQFQALLLNCLTRNYEDAISLIARNNGEILEQNAEKYIINLYNSKEKINTEDISRLKAEYKEENTYELIEGYDTLKEIEKLRTEIDTFLTKADSALSVSNAVTIIEFSY